MIDVLIIRLKSWSLVALPILGFLVGQLLQYGLGTRANRQFEGLIIHLVTVILIAFISASVFSNQEHLKESNERIFCIAVSYLFVLGVILGIVR